MQEIDFIKQSSNVRPFIIGVAGGSGSGKTFFSHALVNKLNQSVKELCCEIVYQDNFYIDQSHKFDHDGGSVNFDHPDAIDFSLLANCLYELKQGNSTEIPVYDFASHKRQTTAIKLNPTKIIIVDGILIFHSEPVRRLFDDLIFFETPETLRFQRRLERDVKERGRTPEGVHQQFHKQVKPMHDLFVEPTKKFANTIVNDVGQFNDILDEYFKKLLRI
jgi:uridine kinase